MYLLLPAPSSEQSLKREIALAFHRVETLSLGLLGYVFDTSAPVMSVYASTPLAMPSPSARTTMRSAEVQAIRAAFPRPEWLKQLEGHMPHFANVLGETCVSFTEGGAAMFGKVETKPANVKALQSKLEMLRLPNPYISGQFHPLFGVTSPFRFAFPCQADFIAGLFENSPTRLEDRIAVVTSIASVIGQKYEMLLPRCLVLADKGIKRLVDRAQLDQAGYDALISEWSVPVDLSTKDRWVGWVFAGLGGDDRGRVSAIEIFTVKRTVVVCDSSHGFDLTAFGKVVSDLLNANLAQHQREVKEWTVQWATRKSASVWSFSSLTVGQSSTRRVWAWCVGQYGAARSRRNGPREEMDGDTTASVPGGCGEMRLVAARAARFVHGSSHGGCDGIHIMYIGFVMIFATMWSVFSTLFLKGQLLLSEQSLLLLEHSLLLLKDSLLFRQNPLLLVDHSPFVFESRLRRLPTSQRHGQFHLVLTEMQLILFELFNASLEVLILLVDMFQLIDVFLKHRQLGCQLLLVGLKLSDSIPKVADRGTPRAFHRGSLLDEFGYISFALNRPTYPGRRHLFRFAACQSSSPRPDPLGR